MTSMVAGTDNLMLSDKIIKNLSSALDLRTPNTTGLGAWTNQYTTNMARRVLGLAYSVNKDGNVQYFSRSKDVIKRAAIQTVSQAAYGSYGLTRDILSIWKQSI